MNMIEKVGDGRRGDVVMILIDNEYKKGEEKCVQHLDNCGLLPNYIP